MIRRPTVISDAEPAPAPAPERITITPDVELRPVPVPTAHERKITGVLVTFSWRPQGQLFAIYEGRNVIGAGTVESEGGRDCDIQIKEDRTLSNEHAVILSRNGRHDLIDRFSANGTYLNGNFVENQGATLPDGASIRTGATVWVFRTIEVNRPGPEGPAAKPPAPEPSPTSQPPPGPDWPR